MLGGALDKEMVKEAMDELKNMSPEDLQQMMTENAKLINMMTGEGDLGDLSSLMDLAGGFDGLGDIGSLFGFD